MKSALRHAVLAAKACDDFRGKDLVILDLTGITAIFDYFVIATAATNRQMHALAEEVDRVISEQGSRRLGVEGYNSGSWILEDFGDIVLHVFSPEARELYDLERLWGDAPRIDWKPLVAEIEALATA